MKFTQFMFPDGRRVAEWIKRADAVEALANELIKAGWSFEIECFPETQLIHMDCCDEDEALSNRVCRNGPEVPEKVDELVNEAHATWLERDKPAGVGARASRALWRRLIK